MLFQAPPEMFIQWDIRTIKGVHRWLNRVWTITHEHINACDPYKESDSVKKLVSLQHKTIKQVRKLLAAYYKSDYRRYACKVFNHN